MIIKDIEKLLKNVFETLAYPTENIEVIVSNRKDLCDYQFDGSFKLAKVLRKSPLEIGKTILEELNNQQETTSMFSKVELLAPGFINFTLSDSYINSKINQMITEDKFAITMPHSETIVIDYGGPNIAKPLHVGHLRSAILGESIKRMLAYLGHKMIADVHFGDYGLQIGQVIYGLKQENITLENITLEKLEELYPKISGICKENEEIKSICATITKELQDGNPEYQAYFQKIKELSVADIKRMYKYIYVDFDLWNGESDAYPYIEKLTPVLEKMHLLKDSDGAKIIEVAKESDTKEVPPLIYQKQNGAYLYGTTDLGAIVERNEKFNPDRMIYITDSRQALHFESLFRVCELIGWTEKTEFEHLGYGTVNGKDGKPFKTRAGNSPKLDSLFEETKEAFLASNEKNKEMSKEDIDKVVNAIIKFADLQNNREKDYIFDISKFSEVVGKTGPYILYTYIRIQNIIKNIDWNSEELLNQTIYNKEDRDLRLKILELENSLKNACNLRLPSILANFIYELCVNMNAFYEKNHINNLEDVKKQENWLILLNLANNILKSMLDLLSIKIPERM